MSTWGSKGKQRTWMASGLIGVSGNFIVSGTAIAQVHPVLGGFTMTRTAAGVYIITLAQAFAAVVSSDVSLGPDTGSTGTLPTVAPAAVMISKGFLSASATNFVADTTSTKLLIICTNSGALTELPANYRMSFDLQLAENKLSV